MDPRYLISKAHLQLVEIRQRCDEVERSQADLADVRDEIHQLRVMIRRIDLAMTEHMASLEAERKKNRPHSKARHGYRWPLRR